MRIGSKSVSSRSDSVRFESGRVLVVQGGVFGCLSRMNGKPSRPVLRGLGASNGARLLDSYSEMGSEKFSNSAKSGYNKGTIRSDIRYLVVSKDVRRHRLISISYVSQWRCHGRGREFESRRPRHILKDLQLGRCLFWVQLGCNRICDCRYPQLHWQNRFDQLLLGSASRARCRLQILVGHTEIAVTQVIADRQLMLSHLRQQRSDCVPKRMPAHTADPKRLNQHDFPEGHNVNVRSAQVWCTRMLV